MTSNKKLYTIEQAGHLQVYKMSMKSKHEKPGMPLYFCCISMSERSTTEKIIPLFMEHIQILIKAIYMDTSKELIFFT